MDLVNQGEARGFPVLRATVRRDSRQGHVLRIEDDLLGAVVRVIDAGRGDQALILPDNVRGLAETDPGLFTVGRGENDLTGRDALGADCVQKREGSGEAGLPVPARDHQEDVAHDPGAVRVARAIDAPDDPLLPRKQLEGAPGFGALRVAQTAQEPHRVLAIPEGIRDRAAIINPRGKGAAG